MGVCIAPLPSPTLLIRVGSHIAARIQPPLSGNTNGPSDALKVLLVKELWVVTRRGEEQRGEERGLAFPVKRKKTGGNKEWEAADLENGLHLQGSGSEVCACVCVRQRETWTFNLI